MVSLKLLQRHTVTDKMVTNENSDSSFKMMSFSGITLAMNKGA